MSARRYETTGRNHWENQSGYRHTSDPHAVLQRTRNTTPFLSRVGLVLVLVVLAITWFVGS